MTTIKFTAVTFAVAIALATQTAHADGFLAGIAHAAGNAVGGPVGNAVNGTATAGDDVSRQIQRGNVPGAIQSSGQAVVSMGQIPSGAISTLGRATGNRDVARVANAYASVVSINSDALGTATIISGNVLAGQDPRQVYAAPLAAAIRQARNAHIDGARAIPDDIQQALRGTIPDYILENARYTEGELQITIANTINRGNRAFGDDFAVTVGDVIVFSEAPSSDPDDEEALHWWAHELTHVWQYSRWGVDQFALNYMNNYSAVENDANHVADVAIARYAAVASN